YSTFLGGNNEDTGNSIAVDSAGSAYITGSTKSTNFPQVQPLQAAPGGGADAFVAQMNPAGAAFVRSSTFGGTGDDTGFGIAADTSRIWIVGLVQAIKPPPPAGGGPAPPPPTPTFPVTANAYQAAYGGGDSDAFAVAIRGGTIAYATFLGREGAE